MLKRFEIGKEYRVLNFGEMITFANTDEWGNAYLDTKDVDKHNDMAFIPYMQNFSNLTFEARDKYVKKYENYIIQPWMCVPVKFSESKTVPSKKYEKHTEICKEMNEIYKDKNHDYGDSFGETYKTLGIISAVTRITDKVNRLQSLCTKDALVDESIKDTLMDLANYSIMTLIELEGEDN